MKYKKKAIIFLFALLISVFPYRLVAQEVFSVETPSESYLQNIQKDRNGMLRAGGGTGTGDGTNPGGGTDNPGKQNDAPVHDLLWPVLLLAAGYGVCRRMEKQRSALANGELKIENE